jgi:hypothetical protein
MTNRTWALASLALILALTAPVTWIASAYAVQLNAMGAVTPAGGFQVFFEKNGRLGMKVPVNTLGTSKNNFQMIVTASPLVINSETFMVRWLETVKKNKSNLLWSSYPASIRGQVFGHNPAGGDPFKSGGW